MKIVGCFKIAPDLDMLGEAEWRAKEGLLPETKYVRNIYSCYDETVLELVLRAKEQGGAEAEALTVKAPETFFKTDALYAVGYDRVIELTTSQSGRAPELIARFVRHDPEIGCVVMGCQSQDWNGFQVPYEVAERLDWTCISEVDAFEQRDVDLMWVRQRENGVERELLVRLPCVLVVGTVPKTYLRIPTLKQKMAAKSKMVHRVPCEPEEDDRSAVLVQTTFLERTRKAEAMTSEQLKDIFRELAAHTEKGSGT